VRYAACSFVIWMMIPLNNYGSATRIVMAGVLPIVIIMDPLRGSWWSGFLRLLQLWIRYADHDGRGSSVCYNYGSATRIVMAGVPPFVTIVDPLRGSLWPGFPVCFDFIDSCRESIIVAVLVKPPVNRGAVASIPLIGQNRKGDRFCKKKSGINFRRDQELRVFFL
jgi:hypothetical protein